MEKTTKDIVIELAIQLDLPDILQFCLTSKKINNYVCSNKDFWIRKMYLDYGIKFADINYDDPRKYYENIRKLKTTDFFNYSQLGNDDPKVYYDFIKERGDYYNAGFINAARRGYMGLVRYYIKKGANQIETATKAAEKGEHWDIVNYLNTIPRSNVYSKLIDFSYVHA